MVERIIIHSKFLLSPDVLWGLRLLVDSGIYKRLAKSTLASRLL